MTAILRWGTFSNGVQVREHRYPILYAGGEVVMGTMSTNRKTFEVDKSDCLMRMGGWSMDVANYLAETE